jgi:hypothetical protein
MGAMPNRAASGFNPWMWGETDSRVLLINSPVTQEGLPVAADMRKRVVDEALHLVVFFSITMFLSPGMHFSSSFAPVTA